MELFGFLISFFLVNVSTYNINDYERDVFITNAYIELAYNKTNFILKDHFVANGLEHVIKTIVGKKEQSLKEMVNMIAVPEYRHLRDWNVCKKIQEALREKIQFELNISVPLDPDQNFRRLNLVELGQNRRLLTGKALKNILKQSIDYGDLENLTRLIKERRFLRTDALENGTIRALDNGIPENVTNLIENRRLLGNQGSETSITRALAGPEEDISLLCMCYLIALFMSTELPHLFIEDIEIDFSNGTCTLKNIATNITYKKIEGHWCEVDVHNVDNIVQPLKEQLR